MCEMNYSSFLDGLIPKRLQLNLLITCSAVLPSKAADSPVRPTVPRITSSASISLATVGITSSGKPSRT